MLPGFRILFAIVLLSVSVLVFGVGAAAFLRAAHDNLASNPSWRPIEAAYSPRIEPSKTETLSMMRVETTKELGAPSARIDQPASLSLARPPEEPSMTAPVADQPAASPADTLNADDLTTASVGAPPVEARKPEAAIETPKPVANNAIPVTPEPSVTPTALPQAASADTSSDSPAKSAKADDNADAAKTIAAAPDLTAKADEPAPPQQDQALDAPAAREQQSSLATAAPETSPPAETTPQKADQIAVLQKPALPPQPPLPISKVKIPKPRIDPTVIEAQRQELRIRQQRATQTQAAAKANARAKARRIAAVRAARVAAQTRATDPFGQPIQQAPTATR